MAVVNTTTAVAALQLALTAYAVTYMQLLKLYDSIACWQITVLTMHASALAAVCLLADAPWAPVVWVLGSLAARLGSLRSPFGVAVTALELAAWWVLCEVNGEGGGGHASARVLAVLMVSNAVIPLGFWLAIICCAVFCPLHPLTVAATRSGHQRSKSFTFHVVDRHLRRGWRFLSSSGDAWVDIGPELVLHGAVQWLCVLLLMRSPSLTNDGFPGSGWPGRQAVGDASRSFVCWWLCCLVASRLHGEGSFAVSTSLSTAPSSVEVDPLLAKRARGAAKVGGGGGGITRGRLPYPIPEWIMWTAAAVALAYSAAV